MSNLAVGQTRRRMDLEALRRFGGVRQLFLEGHTKNLGVVSSFVQLVDLTLRSITLPDLEELFLLDMGTRSPLTLPASPGIRRFERKRSASAASGRTMRRQRLLECLGCRAARAIGDGLRQSGEGLPCKTWLATMHP